MNPATNWAFREQISPTVIQPGPVFDVAVPIQLTARRIYHYFAAKYSAPDGILIYGSLQLLKDGRLVGEMPMETMDTSNPAPVNQSAIELVGAGGSPIGDSIQLTLANPWDTTTKVLLQPLRISAQIDTIRFLIRSRSGAGLLGFRCFVGCLSSDVY